MESDRMSITTLLFDFGGTLNSDGDHWGALFRRRWCEEADGPSVEECEEAYIFSERELVRRGLAQESFQETLRLQAALQHDRLGRRHADGGHGIADEFYAQTVERMAEIRRFFEEIHGDFRLGIVSNFYGNLRRVCDEFELTPYLSLLVDSAIEGVRKPDTAIWTLAMERLGVEPEATGIVGDSWKNDIGPGNALGCTTIWYRGLEWRPADPSWQADHQVGSIDELRSVIDGLK
jgi:putative hydrolase of the HAD superfamily